MVGQIYKCKKPPPYQLAVNAPHFNTPEYDAFFEPHAEYWEWRTMEALRAGDDATLRVADPILGQPLTILAQNTGRFRSEMRVLSLFAIEARNDILTDRRYALNMLAGSVLCKQLMSPDVVVKDGRYTKTDELVSPEIGFWDDQRKPLDPRVQITPSLADRLVKPYRGDNPATWYRYQAPDDKLELFVRRTLTAEPVVSSQADQKNMTISRGTEIDYTSVQTLFPYLVSRA